MKILNEKELKSIEIFFQLKEETLLKTMKEYLKKHYEKIHMSKDYLIAIGEIPVALIAHLDTVFPYSPSHIYYDRVKNVMWSPEGLGADDRAGVYSIVQIIKSGYRPTIIFTTDEEVGALGAREIVKVFPKAPTELKYIIQLDRRGYNDCVFYNCDNTNFEQYIESFGFMTKIGSFSDISVICPAWEVAGVNLSVGYYDEHSRSETLHVDEMLTTIQKVKNMLKDINNAEFYKYVAKPYLSDWYSKDYFGEALTKFLKDNKDRIENNPLAYAYDDTYDDTTIYDEHQIRSCALCEVNDHEYNMYPIKTSDNKTAWICLDCMSYADILGWCERCGEAFYYPDDPTYTTYNSLCKDCIKEQAVKVEVK